MPLRSGNRCTTCNDQRHDPNSTHPECKHCVRHADGVVTRPIMPTLLYHPSDLSWAPATPITAFSGSPSTLDSLAIPSASTMPSIIPDDRSDLLAAQLEGSPDRRQPSLSLPQDVFSSADLFDFSLPVDPTWHASLQLPTLSAQSSSPPSLGNTKLAHDNQTGAINETSTGAISTTVPSKRHVSQQPSVSPTQSLASKPYSRPTQFEKRRPHDSDSTEHMTSGQASLFQALFSLAGPEETVPKSSSSALVRASPQSHASTWRSPHSDEESDAESDEDEDPEGVEKALCSAPRMDGNVQTNTLAFVLGCYARWFNLTMFDPLRIITQAKENIVSQFSNSETDRTRIILVANAFHAMERTADLSSRGVSLVSVLRTGVHESIAQFNASQPSPLRELDIQYALVTLKNMLEVIVIHFYCSPLSVIFGLMQHAAPVFRRACSEPLDQLPNLPSILLAPELPKRYFAAIDVGLSVLSARPMFFRYDVTYPRDFFNQPLPPDYGVEWLHGIPDRFVVMFAWINALGEDYGTEVDPGVIADIEEQITNAQMTLNCRDASLRLRKMAVQECWRQASLIYLYLKLCGVNVKDPRVVQAFRKFMSIEGSIKSGRHPDAFMFIPMIVAGVAACKKSDREKVRRRMLGTRECSISGIVGNGHVRVLQDLWTRMDQLQGVATWTDFRASNERVIGV